MIPAAFVVVLAAFLVQVSDGREIDQKRVENLQPTLVPLRDIREREGLSQMPQGNSNPGPQTVVKNVDKNVYQPLHKDSIRQRVVDQGFWATLIYVITRGINLGTHFVRELIWVPFNLMFASGYGVLKLFGKLK